MSEPDRLILSERDPNSVQEFLQQLRLTLVK